MEDKNQAGKKPENTATGDEGNKPETSPGPTVADLQAKLAKAEKEKEIYRSGLLTAKKLGKEAKRLTQEEVTDPEKVEELVESKIAQKELEKKAETEAAASADELERLRIENEELTRSLAAKNAGAGHGGGSGHSEVSEAKPSGYWSDTQKAELRRIYQSRGFYNPDLVEKMVADAEKNAMSYANKGTSATLEKGNSLIPTRKY